MNAPSARVLLRRALPLLVAGALIGMIVVLWLLPEWLLRWDLGDAMDDQLVSQPTLLDAYRQTVLKALGGVIVGIGLYFTYRRLRQTDETNRISEEGQVTERFTRAIEQLGSEQTAIQLGGIYALERIMRDSPKDHATVMEVLSAFIRENATEQANEPLYEEPGLPPDVGTIAGYCVQPVIQAAVTALGRRHVRSGEPRINLRGVWLRQYNLRGARLDGANLRKAGLDSTDLRQAHLNGAFLEEARLTRASLVRASLDKAKLHQTRLDGANLARSCLRNAVLYRANLTDAYLERSILNGANLHNAHLAGASLVEAHFEGAWLRGQDLGDARFSLRDVHGALIDDILYEQGMPDPRTEAWKAFVAERKAQRSGSVTKTPPVPDKPEQAGEPGGEALPT